jgi:adenosylcobinamide-phosphate synthase
VIAAAVAPCAIAIAYAMDAAFGEPPDAIHPVAWMGRVIAVGRDWALGAARVGQLARGAILALAIPSVAASLAWLVTRAVDRSPLLAVLVVALLLKPMFAVRALRDAAFAVRDALARGDIDGARRALGSLCSRKSDALDAESLAAATVESVAENTSDSVVAPLFFFVCFGLPGAVFYRATNTLDAMVGYHGRFEYAGKASARLDDVLNFVPARITALLLLAGGAVTGGDARRGARILRRDGARTESPNAGRPMAAMAGLLGVRLEKEGHYALGDAHETMGPRTITRAWRTASVASLAAFALAVVGAYALGGLRG